MKKSKAVSKIASAPLGKRFLAFIIDWYLSSMLALIPVVVASSIQKQDLVLDNRIDGLPLPWAILVTLGAFILSIMYFCVFPLIQTKSIKKGQTLGRKFMNLTLVSSNAKPLNFTALLIRDFVGLLLLQGVLTSTNIYLMSVTQMITQTDVVPYFQSVYFVLAAASTLLLVFGQRKQTFHDLISHTRMIACE